MKPLVKLKDDKIIETGVAVMRRLLKCGIIFSKQVRPFEFSSV